MATKVTALKTQKPKRNNFVPALDQILKKHNLSTNSTPEQLSEHADELNAFLPDWQAKEQIGAFVPDVRKKKLTIRERAQHCAETGDKWDIYIHAMDLLPKNDDEKDCCF
jgi:hypothetical protein